METPDRSLPQETDSKDAERLGRRDFLRRSAAAAGAVIGTAAGGAVAQEKDATIGNGPPLPVLTHDGQLLYVDANGVRGCPPNDKKTIREGVPGRKWVMVIDLASCDGCGE